MRTEMSLISSSADWLICLSIVVIATVGKMGGAFLSAKAFGFGHRHAGAIGSLLNSRGLVELIVLNVGLDLGIISPRLFTILVIMAILTTFGATPIALSFFDKDLD
jgi:Kef-type K+ transport system membrane component KefB